MDRLLEATSTETAATTTKGSSFATVTPSTPPHTRLKRSIPTISNRCSIATSHPPPGIISSKVITSAVVATTISPQPSRPRSSSMITINRSRMAVITMICRPSRQKLPRIGRRRFRIPLEEGTFKAMRTPGSTNATIIWVVEAIISETQISHHKHNM